MAKKITFPTDYTVWITPQVSISRKGCIEVCTNEVTFKSGNYSLKCRLGNIIKMIKRGVDAPTSDGFTKDEKSNTAIEFTRREKTEFRVSALSDSTFRLYTEGAEFYSWLVKRRIKNAKVD